MIAFARPGLLPKMHDDRSRFSVSSSSGPGTPDLQVWGSYFGDHSPAEANSDSSTPLVGKDGGFFGPSGASSAEQLRMKLMALQVASQEFEVPCLVAPPGLELECVKAPGYVVDSFGVDLPRRAMPDSFGVDVRRRSVVQVPGFIDSPSHTPPAVPEPQKMPSRWKRSTVDAPQAPGLVIRVPASPPSMSSPTSVSPSSARQQRMRGVSPRHSAGGNGLAEGAVVSIGSIGHPHVCQDACPYVKRKGGCKEGANCTKCHLCFWRKRSKCATSGSQTGRSTPSSTETSHTPNSISSRSSAVPTPPKPGKAMTQSSAKTTAPQLVTAFMQGPAPTNPNDGCGSDVPLSVGSIGHPNSCGQACKYHSKGKGCKDGRCCIRCHHCTWKRYGNN